MPSTITALASWHAFAHHYLVVKVLNKPEVFVEIAAGKINVDERSINDEDTRRLLTQHLLALQDLATQRVC
ncbi:hypothetical protein [Pseudomonas sp. DWRC2-2]|uniref:hypothetical protein n=1 Tax=Pseudomonas sp. DWRC2-2 TaxID=2804567 RepID=UPI003CE88112